MMISKLRQLPVELQNKIFFYVAEHPCAKMIRKHIELSEEDEEGGYFCYPSNVLSELSNVFPASCDYCKKNGRMINWQWFGSTGDKICQKCLKDEEIKKQYYNHFLPDY